MHISMGFKYFSGKWNRVRYYLRIPRVGRVAKIIVIIFFDVARLRFDSHIGSAPPDSTYNIPVSQTVTSLLFPSLGVRRSLGRECPKMRRNERFKQGERSLTNRIPHPNATACTASHSYWRGCPDVYG